MPSHRHPEEGMWFGGGGRVKYCWPVPVLEHVVGGWFKVPLPGGAAGRALCQPVLLAPPDPGPPGEDEELKAPASQVCLERLKETVALQPKRLQHLPGHPG